MARIARMSRIALVGAALPVLAAPARPAFAQSQPIVYVVPIEGMIDMGLAPFVQRVLDMAAAEGAAAVILDINTFGGRVDAAVAIRDALLSSSVRTVAFINRRAISAGALISLAAHSIAITDGGTIGAATPVQMGQPGEGASPVDEKSVSYVRKEFRATADVRKRSPIIAEAMVDSDVEIAGLVDKGKLLTLTTDEALEHKIADFRAGSIDAVLEQIGAAGAEVRYTSLNWGERVVRLITHPVVASLLLSLGMIGILLEIRTPGFGVPGAVGLGSLVLVLGGHYIVQLVGWEELLLVGLGLGLIALEIFVIPGFGVAGVVGGAAVLAALTMALIGSGPTIGAVMAAAERVAISLLAALAASFLLLRLLPKVPIGRRLMLSYGLPAGAGYTADFSAVTSWAGRAGVATSPLRPVGFAEIGGERMEVVAEGEMIEAGAAVVVARVDGNRIVVRRQRAPAEETTK